MKKLLTIPILLIIILLISCSNNLSVIYIIGHGQENIIGQIDSDGHIVPIDSPSVENRVFFGWYTDEDFNSPFDFNSLIEKNTILYARYSLYELGKENYLRYKDDDKYGFLTPLGETIVDAKYDYVDTFRYGYALVVKDNQFTFIDTIGNEISRWFEWESNISTYLSNNVHFSKDGIVVLIDSNKTNIIYNILEDSILEVPKFYIQPGKYFENGLVSAYKKDTNGEILYDSCVYINAKGEIEIESDFIECSNFSDGFAVVKTQQSKNIIINSLGEIVSENNYGKFNYMNDGIKPVIFRDGYAITTIGNIGSVITNSIINTSGDIIFEIEINDFTSPNDKIIDFYDGYVLTYNNSNQIAVYNLSKEKILDYIYYEPNQLSLGLFDGMVVVRNEDGTKYGAYNLDKSELTVNFDYDYLSPFKDGYSVAKKDGLYGVVDKNNNIIIPFAYSYLSNVYHVNTPKDF